MSKIFRYDGDMRKGFTLIEVLTVVVIIGILVGITGYTYQSAMTRSRDNTRKTDLATIKNALEQYYLENREYPFAILEKSAGGAIPREGDSLSAKYQLEKQPNCVYGHPSDRQFLATKYISSIPTDPKAIISYSNGCVSSPATLVNKYLYLPLQNLAEPVSSYYLAAGMEIKTNSSSNLPDYSTYGRTKNHIESAISNGGLKLCSGEAVSSSCTHNYFIKSR